MAFIIYDIILLIIFAVFMSIFLYLNRKNLRKEGLLLLYKADWGIKLINYVGNKYKKTLRVLSYISIALGYVLMVSMIYLFGKIVYLYITSPQIVKAVKVPPIMPLIPYLPQAFNLNFLPPFYFTYWIIIIALIAITHEFAHGIFAAYNKIKIKSTGFGFFPFFLPIFLAAFVELDEKKMSHKKKLPQMAILSAGTFANILTAIFFFIVLWAFFSLAFVPSGITFDSYASSSVAIASISSINGISLQDKDYENILSLANESGLNEIKSNGREYLATKEILEMQKQNTENISLYDSAPAINAGLLGAIIEVNGVGVSKITDFQRELLKNSPGENIAIKTKIEGEVLEYEIILEEHPEIKNTPWLGIGFVEQKSSGVIGKMYMALSSFKEPNVYYEPKYDGFSLFIYNLLWWIILISMSVALVNMLPVGIFDGGRFFYLTILGITGSEKKAKKTFSFATYLFLFLLFLIMIFWVFSVIYPIL